MSEDIRRVLAACGYQAVARRAELGVDLDVPGTAELPPLRRSWRFTEEDEGEGRLFLFDRESDESYRLDCYALQWALLLLVDADLKSRGYSDEVLDCRDEDGRPVATLFELLDFGLEGDDAEKSYHLGAILGETSGSSYDESMGLAEKHGVAEGFELCINISMEKI